MDDAKQRMGQNGERVPAMFSSAVENERFDVTVAGGVCLRCAVVGGYADRRSASLKTHNKQNKCSSAKSQVCLNPANHRCRLSQF